jgi:hypothetical protein
MPKKEKSIEEQIKEETAMLIDSFLRWKHEFNKESYNLRKEQT